MARKPKRVEIGLRLDDMVILREAGRSWRVVMMKRLHTLKDEMQKHIKAVEVLDDTLTRLDLSIAKAEAAFDEQQAERRAPADRG